MMRFLILGALVAVATAGGYHGGYAPAISPVYGAPRIDFPVALPAPHPVYSIAPSYVPAPVLRSIPIPAPVISSGYSYHTAPQPIPFLKSYAPVYHAPRFEAVIPAAPVYAAPRYEIPRPVLSSYAYSAPHYNRFEVPLPRLAAHPAPLYSGYNIPAPHTRYGVPHF